jgi:thiamine pyrophosphate-dependent acetolactate synthase large subunit-like protein
MESENFPSLNHRRDNPTHLGSLSGFSYPFAREVMPDNGVVALDNGMYKIWFARLYPVRPFLGSTNDEVLTCS